MYVNISLGLGNVLGYFVALRPNLMSLVNHIVLCALFIVKLTVNYIYKIFTRLEDINKHTKYSECTDNANLNYMFV